LNAPEILLPTLQARVRPELLLAGQLIGVEGYLESASAGYLAGLNAARLARGEEVLVPPASTAIGSLLAYVTQPGRKGFQPINVNYGIFPPLDGVRVSGATKKLALADRSLLELDPFQQAAERDGARAA
jgi:methylenetetrahydrofolate--tRNA-(uracil-5-)-methyltransferase